MRVRMLAVSCALAAATGHDVCAQQPGARLPEPRPAGPRTIVGIVRDSAGNAVDSVEVIIFALRRKALSASDGSFRLDDVKQQEYELGARRLGFYPQVRTVHVGKEGGVVTFELVPLVQGLAPVVTSAVRGGLSGVIGDTAFNVLQGVEVKVLSAAREATSDSTGSFFIDVKPGKYMVRVRRPGYGTRMLSVNVPKDSGRQILVWLAPGTRALDVRESVALFDLAMAQNRRNPVWDRMLTREDILHQRNKNLTELATTLAGGRVDAECFAIVDGGPRKEPLWLYEGSDIEALEVAVWRPQRRTVTSINGMRPIASGPNRGCPMIYVWLRK